MKKKIEIKKAKTAGFCFGVKRAVTMTEKALKNPKSDVFCWGELIHNPQVIKKLEKAGLKTTKSFAYIKKGDFLIIRSHGVGPEVFEKAKKKGINVIDATCPFVSQAQKVAAEFEKQGRQVVIFGDPKHSEVIGIKGFAKKSLVIKNIQESKKLKNFSHIGFLAQTTQKKDEFKKIEKELEKCSQDLVVQNTICLDSFNKKEEVGDLSRKVDVMIIVGGKNSNNTKKLAEVSKKNKTKTYHIEDAQEIKKNWLTKAQKIGIAAGASTPDESIQGVIKKIKEII